MNKTHIINGEYLNSVPYMRVRYMVFPKGSEALVKGSSFFSLCSHTSAIFSNGYGKRNWNQDVKHLSSC